MTVETGTSAIAGGTRLAKRRVSARPAWPLVGISAAFVAVTLLYLTTVIGPLRLQGNSVTFLALGLGIAPPGLAPPGLTGTPFGYPALLRLINDVGLGSASGVVAVNLVLLAIAVAVVYRLSRRPLGLSPIRAALVCLAVLLSQAVSQLSPLPVSDIPAFAAAMTCLWALTAAEARSGRPRVALLLLGVLLAALATWVRTEYLALVPAVVFVAVGAPNLRRGWQLVRRHRRLAAGASPLLLLASIGVTILVIRATPYSHVIAYVWRDIHSVGALVARVGSEAKVKLMSIGELAVQADCCRHLGPSFAPIFAAAGVGVLALLVLGWRERPRLGPIEVFVLSTALVVLVFAGGAPSYWLPAVPFMMVYALFAGERLARIRGAKPALIVLLVGFAAAGTGRLVQSTLISTAGRAFPRVWATQYVPELAATYRVAFGEPQRGDERRVSRLALTELRRYDPLARR